MHIELGAVLFQLNDQNQLKVISYNSRILNPREQKLSTLERELLGIVHALQIYEIIIKGSPHPIHVFTDHKPLLYCFTIKGNLRPRAQMQLTKFSKLKIIHTPGKIFLLLIYSVDLLLKMNYKSINSNINIFHLILILQYYKTTHLNPYIT